MNRQAVSRSTHDRFETPPRRPRAALLATLAAAIIGGLGACGAEEDLAPEETDEQMSQPLDNGPQAVPPTMDELKKSGYSCERAGVNFHECTKEGGPRYYCTDAGQCQAARRSRATPRSAVGVTYPITGQHLSAP